MKAQDIIWGGNNKCEIILKSKIKIEEGQIIELRYNYISESYEVSYDGEVTLVSLDHRNKKVLDNIYLNGNTPTTIVRVIDISEFKCIVDIKIFNGIIEFNDLSGIEIEVEGEIIRKIGAKYKENPIEYLNSNFKYKDMMFVKGYARKSSDFTILSKNRAIHVKQNNNVYSAINIVNYDRSKADFEAVYILKGKVDFVNVTQGALISKEVSERMRRISNGSSYFNIWDAYNNLERLFIFKQATENGIIEYDGYECELTDSFEYRFHLVNRLEDPFPEGSQVDCTDNNNIKNLNQLQNAEEIRSLDPISIGIFSEIVDDTCVIIDKSRSSQIKLPNKGYLFYSVVGDSIRIMRRESARNNIIANKTPLANLQMIIDKGIGIDKQRIYEQPITNRLKRKFQNYEFNEKQREAIEVALNTPDIALILGPPGTGKTTVIKAIIARFEEYFKKYNDNQIPKILVSSFQHEAVENVIVGVDENGIPSNRKGGKRDEENKQTLNIRKWRNDVTEKIQNKIEELVGTLDVSRETLRDKIYAWEQKGKDATEGIELLKTTVKENRLKISVELNSDINDIISRTILTDNDNNSVKNEILEEEKEEVIKILESQRLTQTSYADDGKKQIINLKVAIFSGIIEYENDIKFIDDVLNSKGKDIDTFNNYVKEVEKLKKKYIQDEHISTAISSIISIEQCLKRLDDELDKVRLERIENRDEAIAYVLRNYIEAIQDEHEIQNIIDKYSNITAATCQQSMEIGKNAIIHEYDLVIVDEAARANPLDLFIPLSMGKKIILVGDFLQLPHMLDPEVIKQFEKDEEMQGLDILKKSLFQKLYENFSRRDAKVKRTVQLTKQYRMNTVIGEFANEAFYEPREFILDSSEVDDSMKEANLDMYENKPIAWINADKNRYGMEEGKRSKSRSKEAERIIVEVKEVLKRSPNKTIGVISFYKKQSDLLKKMIEKNLTDTQAQQVEVGTVDSFQGKEFDVVFLSCVRANNISLDDMKHRVGHIQDESRLCVSFTRAKQLLVVVGDRDTVECVPVLKKFILKCLEKGVGYYE